MSNAIFLGNSGSHAILKVFLACPHPPLTTPHGPLTCLGQPPLVPSPTPVSPPGEEAGEEAAKNSFKWSHKGIERHLVRILGVNMPYRGLN